MDSMFKAQGQHPQKVSTCKGSYSSLARNWLLGLCLAVQPVFAVEVEGLYEAAVEVAIEDAPKVLDHARTGLAQVLVRVTGSEESLLQPAIRQALRQPEGYLQQYGYEQQQRSLVEGEDAEVLVLRLHFDQRLIDQLLRETGQPIWGKNRPSLLLWITLDEEGDRHILSADELSLLKSGIVTRAQQRGLPIMFPLMDLTDEANLSEVEAWALFRSSIENASKRYQPEAILAGRLFKDIDGQWSGRWVFLFNGQEVGFNHTDPELTNYALPAIDFATDQLARHYAVSTTTRLDGGLLFQVGNVQSISDYAQLLRYLESLASIEQVELIEIAADKLTFLLQITGETQKLFEVIALDHKLLPHAPSDSSLSSVSKYRWNPKQ